MIKRLFILIIAGLMVLAILSCTKKTYSRDHIPVLREKLFKLQIAVVASNRAAIDSLMAVEMLDYNLSSDSLLGMVYGPGRDLAFTQFGNAEIFYTQDKARVDCYMMDSTRSENRPISFTLKLDNGIWLFKRFEFGHPNKVDADSTESDD